MMILKATALVQPTNGGDLDKENNRGYLQCSGHSKIDLSVDEHRVCSKIKEKILFNMTYRGAWLAVGRACDS